MSEFRKNELVIVRHYSNYEHLLTIYQKRNLSMTREYIQRFYGKVFRVDGMSGSEDYVYVTLEETGEHVKFPTIMLGAADDINSYVNMDLYSDNPTRYAEFFKKFPHISNKDVGYCNVFAFGEDEDAWEYQDTEYFFPLEKVLKNVKFEEDIMVQGKSVERITHTKFEDAGNMVQETEKLHKVNLSKHLKTIIGLIGGMVVEGKGIGLTPSGISIDNKVYSKKDGTLFEAKDVKLLKDIPVGFSMPTDVKNLEVGDVIFDKSEKAFHVINISKHKNPKVTVIDPGENTEKVILPTIDLLGNKTYNKLITPFNYDFGVNPVANVATVVATSYMEGDIEGAIQKLSPSIISLASKVNLNTLMKQKSVSILAPAAIILFRLAGSKDVKPNELLKKMNIKTKYIIMLLALVTLYLLKDKIAEKLVESKIASIPLVGKVAPQLSKALLKIPSFRKRAFQKAEELIK